MGRLAGVIAACALAIGVAAGPAHALEFGVYPGATFTVGKYVGLAGSAPAGPDLSYERMAELAGGRPFQVHLYAQWNRGVTPDVEAALDQIAAAGLKANVALKYVPPAGRDGDIHGFAAWVAEVVEAHPGVAVWQVANEPNVGFTSDSDGAAEDPVGAVIEGVKAAAAVAGPGVKVGFNWFYRLDPVSDRAFWSELGSRGGDAFRAALGYAGVDIYAGTYIPPLYSVDDENDFRTALEYVRDEMMPLAGLGAGVPIYVQETGYPTLAPLRTEERQAEALAGYIRATEGLGVELLQWFQLTDARSPLGDGWGLLRNDWSRKPAFEVMREAVAAG